eukprot:scaffold320850_cov18-Prasinocladus_malaysianus.AAC.1
MPDLSVVRMWAASLKTRVTCLHGELLHAWSVLFASDSPKDSDSFSGKSMLDRQGSWRAPNNLLCRRYNSTQPFTTLALIN